MAETTDVEFAYMEASPEIRFFAWAQPGAAKPDQLHMHMEVGAGYRVILRLKTAAAADSLISALAEHRKTIWGSPLVAK